MFPSSNNTLGFSQKKRIPSAVSKRQVSQNNNKISTNDYQKYNSLSLFYSPAIPDDFVVVPDNKKQYGIEKGAGEISMDLSSTAPISHLPFEKNRSISINPQNFMSTKPTLTSHPTTMFSPVSSTGVVLNIPKTMMAAQNLTQPVSPLDRTGMSFNMSGSFKKETTAPA